jgi:hypothetical protein
MLQQTLGLSAAAALSGCVTGPDNHDPARKSKSDLIRQENARAGAREWMLSNTRIDRKSKYRCPWIEGYCSRTSVRAGEEISFHVSTNPPSPFTLEIFRSGYYNGNGGRLMRTYEPIKGIAKPDPPVGPNRLRDCQWEPSAKLKIPRDWLSGVYLGKLTALRDGCQSYMIFIVRDDRPADFIFQCSDTTWQAYNRWPDNYALYDNGKERWYCGANVDVSFNRPYGKYCQILDAPLSTGSGEWFTWEFPFAYWLEAHGYDVTYISNLDTHFDPRGLRRAKGFLSVGHDEYYSLEMYHSLRAAIGNGLNAGFFSGNTCCGVIDPRPDSRGNPGRVFGRTDYFGPRDDGMIKRFPTMDKFPYQSPNEGLLLGARSNVPPCTGGADWICSAPEHWVYAGTGMKRGDSIPGVIGWEYHGNPLEISGLEILATGPTQNAPGKPNGGIYTATVYPGSKGNIVFNASTCWWGDGLSEPPGYVRPVVYIEPKGPDSRIQQITKNVLERMRQAVS